MSRGRRYGWAMGGAALALGAVVGSTGAEIRGVVARAELASPDRDYELREAAASPTGDTVWIVAAARPRGQPLAADQLVLASVGRSGQVTQTDLTVPGVEAAPADEKRPMRRRLLEGLAVGRDGRPVLAMMPAGQVPSILPLGPTGRVEPGLVRSMAIGAGAFELQEFVSMPDGRMFGLGLADGQVFVAQIAADGRAVWQKRLPVDPLWIERVAPASGGGLLVLGRRATGPNDEVLWLARLGAHGDIETSSTMPGRTGAASQLADGSYVMMSVHRGARGFDLVLRGLGADMRERWSRQVAADQLNTHVRVAAVAGGAVVAATKDRGLWVSRVAADGAVIWTDARTPTPEQLELVGSLELVASGDTLVLPYTASTVEGREQRQSVRIVRFEAR